MNVKKYMICSFLLYILVLYYEILIFLINKNVYEILEKKNVYKVCNNYIHGFLKYGFVLFYIIVSFLPQRNVYKKRSKLNYIFAKLLLLYFIFFFIHFVINLFNNFPLNLFYLIIISFHLSEFFLSFLHNKENPNYYNFLVNPNSVYVYFFILTLFEYYLKIFFFVFLNVYQKYINNQKILHKVLLINYFFLRNYIQNDKICTYTYTNQILIGTSIKVQKNILPNLNTIQNVYEYDKNSNIIYNSFSSQKYLSKKSPYLLSRPYNQYKQKEKQKYKTLEYINTWTYTQIKQQTNNNQYRNVNKTKDNLIINYDNLNNEGQCIFNYTIFTNILEKYTGKKFYKNFDLNNSFPYEIISKHKHVFHTYDLQENYEEKYNHYRFLVLVSLFFCITGMFLRIMGIINCSKSFSFYVLSSYSLEKKYMKGKHNLIKKGIYKYMRHPCYTGWFYYSIFLQLLLSNLFCFTLSFLLSWVYFYRTIKREEKYLLECYNYEYQTYIEQTRSTYIPFMTRI
ncbi:protein-S-isoprenylcysteine O-methyltransferase, putative [Plasmodium reichenowi]|uniref:Protein-S-isoprenylcysteine O-methyltransferase n=1 Tax=Plasmodium reichenowi TaxID=5854 RepID=A0A2P9DIG2_PLARE|nr:protein-S-isoprenylcysteine O-methyltransferase, putative [Plasmodium reichenowi]